MMPNNDEINIHTVAQDCNSFMHNGTACQTLKLVNNYLQEKNYDGLDWPGNSPDLNPIGNLWHVMERLSIYIFNDID